MKERVTWWFNSKTPCEGGEITHPLPWRAKQIWPGENWFYLLPTKMVVGWWEERQKKKKSKTPSPFYPLLTFISGSTCPTRVSPAVSALTPEALLPLLSFPSFTLMLRKLLLTLFSSLQHFAVISTQLCFTPSITGFPRDTSPWLRGLFALQKPRGTWVRRVPGAWGGEMTATSEPAAGLVSMSTVLTSPAAPGRDFSGFRGLNSFTLPSR